MEFLQQACRVQGENDCGPHKKSRQLHIKKTSIKKIFLSQSKKSFNLSTRGRHRSFFCSFDFFFFFSYITESETTPYKASETKDIFYDVIKVIVEVPDQLPIYRLLLGLTSFE